MARLWLDPARDVLIGVNAMEEPGPSACFTGGREHDLAAGKTCSVATEEGLESVLRNRVIASRHRAGVRSLPRRGAAVTLCLALVSARCLENIGHEGPIVLEAPFASNRISFQVLAADMATDVRASKSLTGTSEGAALLVRKAHPENRSSTVRIPSAERLRPPMNEYADVWAEKTAEIRRMDGLLI